LSQQAAQLRAALGIPTGIDASEAHALLHAQAQAAERQRLAQERDYQIRQLILQEQLEKQIAEQRLLAMHQEQIRREEQLNSHHHATAALYPNLNDEYRHILLQEQQMLQQQHQYQQQVNVQHPSFLLNGVLNESEAEKHLLLQEALLRGQNNNFSSDSTSHGANSLFASRILSEATAVLQVAEAQTHQLQPHIPLGISQLFSDDATTAQHFNKQEKPRKTPKNDKNTAKHDKAELPSATLHFGSLDLTPSPPVVKRVRGPKIPGRKPGRPRKEKVQGESLPPKRKYTKRKHIIDANQRAGADKLSSGEVDALSGLLTVYEYGSPSNASRGTLDGLVAAADDDEMVGSAALALVVIKDVGEKDVNFGSDVQFGLKQESRAVESVQVSKFAAAVPALPEEPASWMPTRPVTRVDLLDGLASDMDCDESDHQPSHNDNKKQCISEAIATTTDSLFPVDTWWPSTTSIQRELKQAGEVSDEGIAESPTELSVSKICDNLANKVEPGVLEKLPHCKIHRLRMTKKNAGAAQEFAHCVQVTDLYPNELMVNCTGCGTWRHAACGGHYKPYSSRDNVKEPFVCVCDRCHQEEPYIKKYPKGAQRLERQRMEHLRRAMTTTAVIEASSHKLKSGQKKRVANSRREKAEKQWASMTSTLLAAEGLPEKAQKKIRKKELERLLISIEDVEKATDRHNMIVFLLRDIARDSPIGYQSPPRNIFDPDEVPEWPLRETVNGGTDTKARRPCARKGCGRQQRFDSLFCGDGCGILAMEADLLTTIQEFDAF
jgi:hypothetical protein